MAQVDERNISGFKLLPGFLDRHEQSGLVDAVREVNYVRVAEKVAWDRWLVLLALLVPLVMEWLLRKRWKML